MENCIYTLPQLDPMSEQKPKLFYYCLKKGQPIDHLTHRQVADGPIITCCSQKYYMHTFGSKN